MPLNAQGQFLRTAGDKPLKGTKLPLNFEEFKDDVLAYHNLRSDKVTIRSTKSEKSLSVIAKDFPFWGFWTPSQGGAPFLCLEPWHGHATTRISTAISPSVRAASASQPVGNKLHLYD